jgi:hypothetical protein
LPAARPLWLFGVGAFGDTKRLIGRLTDKEPERITEVRAAVLPREYRVFQGVIRKDQWPCWSRVLSTLRRTLRRPPGFGR